MDLTASEVQNLLTSYMTNTMASVITADLLKKAENPGVKKMLKFGLKIANEEVKGAESFLKSDNRALPEAFTEEDILLRDSKYYSDQFVIILKYSLGQAALNLYSLSLSTSINAKIRTFYKKLLSDTAELVDQCIELFIGNGMHQPIIHIPRTKVIEKIHNQDFFGKIFGKNRPLSTPEVQQLTTNYYSTEVLRELFRSFGQTKTLEIREHFERGVKLCSKQLESIQNMLEKEDLPQFPTWESEIQTDEAPFSERLALFKSSLIVGAMGGRYGVSASATLRKDIGTMFLKMMGETLLYAEDTGNLLIKHKYLDEPPMVK
ncbi:DUF3231 family protein [Radiobacillus sp. PE A8.2]|uniref:DUF3231 family protein n=1 Tax=Radiobacillus sp. PE A8.2 TaxID=3380349 RepID=UPI00388F5AA0